MNHTTADEVPRRRGIVETVKGLIVDAFGATRSRVEDLSAEVQHRTMRMLWLVIWTLVGVTSLWLALCFAVLTVIFGFGLPPLYAFGIPTLAFLVVGLIAWLMFNRSRQSKREPSDYDAGYREP